MHGKTAVIILVGSVTFFAGIAGGLAIGNRRSREPKPAEVPREGPISEHRKTDERNPSPPQESIPPGTAAPERDSGPPSGSDRIAQEVWEMMSTLGSPGVSSTEKRARLRRLRPEMAEFFIRKFRDGAGGSHGRQMAVELAISCGGPRAAAFLEELAQESSERLPGSPFWFAASVLGEGHFAPRPREFPMSDSLMVRTRLWLASVNIEERRMATALLGFADPPVALPLLETAAQTDADPHLRQSAVRQMGRIGNAGTLAYLQANRDSLGAEMYKLYKPFKSGDGVVGVPTDYFSKSIDDAIEELEERLQKK